MRSRLAHLLCRAARYLDPSGEPPIEQHYHVHFDAPTRATYTRLVREAATRARIGKHR